MTSQTLASTLEGFLSGSNNAVVIEDGAVVFDLGIHLPLQGIDYWSRVAWHHARGEFQKFGYFAGREISDQAPLLIMVAPAFHVHPTTDTLLKYISPEIHWTLLGIDERWRKELKVVFRKRPEKIHAA